MPPIVLRLASHWRSGQAFILICCAGMLGYALYEQFAHWLMPCLQCVYQRIGVVALGLTAAVAVVWRPKSRGGVLAMIGAQMLAGLGGIYAAGRHIFMQYVPHDATATCASSLPFPVNFDDPATPAWLAATFRPVGDCSKIDFSLLGLSMPVWVLLAFVGLLGLVAVLGWGRWRAILK